jgi:Arc/MetJ-type ribon-helix-helix transcriptional regulator
MKTSVQARLDPESQAALDGLVRRLGWSPSEVVREGIRLVDKHHAKQKYPKMIGVGEFDSGIPDLATNKKHMEGFGVKSMGRGWRRPKESVSK